MAREVIRLWRLDGRCLDLSSTNMLKRGGEGTIYAVPDSSPELVAKVYHPRANDPNKKHNLLRTVNRLAKLRAMLDNPPENPHVDGVQNHVSIAWPCDLLFASEARTEVRGFLMPRVNGMKPLLEFYNPKARRQTCPEFNYRYLVQMARNLAISVRNLHAKDYVIGDLNELNVLGSLSALVTLVDTDSFQVPDPQHQMVHRCPVGRPEYTPPELQGVRFEHVDRQPKHDLFGLAVLIFQLLMEGTHPFSGRFPRRREQPTWDERIAAGDFPYCRRRKVPCQPMRLAPPFAALHPGLQELFLRCFEEGHHEPQRRPQAGEWHQALDEATGALIECTKNDNHVYGNHLARCPWCERVRLLHYDSFPPTHQRGTPEQSALPTRRPRPPVPRPKLPHASRPAAPIHVLPARVNKRTVRRSSVLLAGVLMFMLVLLGISRFVNRGTSWAPKSTAQPAPSPTQPEPQLLPPATPRAPENPVADPPEATTESASVPPAPVPVVPQTQRVWHSDPSASRKPVSKPDPGQPAPKVSRIPEDLLEVISAEDASLGVLASGSEEASRRQRLAAQQLRLPVEARTRRTGIVLRLVPAGSFMMGSPPGERGRREDEIRHEVTLTTPFFCGKYEVTRAQWEQVMGTRPADIDVRDERGDVPQNQVSWEDGQEFLSELCRVEGVPPGTYRLLTEAEWEYACRADTGTAFCHGDYLYASMANFDGAYARAGDPESPWQNALLRVGSLRPNAWGLYEMHGNVLEWCADWYEPYAGNLREINPQGPGTGDRRVARGGAWMSKAAACRSAARDSFPPGRRSDYLGLRLMRTIPRQ